MGNNVIIAVVGGSGAGKSWFVRRLCRVLGEDACHLTLDDFYRDRSHLPAARRARLNFDVPRAIDWADAERVLRDCRAGLPTRVPAYDFATYSRVAEGRSWSPRSVILVEGLWLLRPPELRRFFDLKLYLDAPTELREARRLVRDTAERGYSAADVRDRFAATVAPMHARYVEPQKRWADLVLSQPFRLGELQQLGSLLWRRLAANDLTPGDNEHAFRAGLVAELADHEYAN